MAPPAPRTALLLPVVTPIALVIVWAAVASAQVFPPSLFPHPWAVAGGVWVELTSGRLVIDAVAS